MTLVALAASFNHAHALALLTVLASGAAGLAFPDVDLRMLGVLHHRSVVTHNVLVPMSLLWATNPEVRLAATGFVLGVSIHLAADVLSRPVGFGTVWLPFPFKLSLGSFSPLWLAANAVAGLAVSRIVFSQAPARLPLPAYAALAGVFALGYAVWHERSLRAFLSFTLIFCLSFAFVNWLSSKPWFKALAWAVR